MGLFIAKQEPQDHRLTNKTILQETLVTYFVQKDRGRSSTCTCMSDIYQRHKDRIF